MGNVAEELSTKLVLSWERQNLTKQEKAALKSHEKNGIITWNMRGDA